MAMTALEKIGSPPNGTAAARCTIGIIWSRRTAPIA